MHDLFSSPALQRQPQHPRVNREPSGPNWPIMGMVSTMGRTKRTWRPGVTEAGCLIQTQSRGFAPSVAVSSPVYGHLLAEQSGAELTPRVAAGSTSTPPCLLFSDKSERFPERTRVLNSVWDEGETDFLTSNGLFNMSTTNLHIGFYSSAAGERLALSSDLES